MSVDIGLYDKNDENVYLTPTKWSATERRLFQVKYKDQKLFRAFELQYSKWAIYNIKDFEDVEILKYTDDGFYNVKLNGETYLEEAQDVSFDSWCGNLEVKKLFKDWHDNELEVFLEDHSNLFKIESVQSDVKCTIEVSDYVKLKKYLIAC